jgi:hypothetical protein
MRIKDASAMSKAYGQEAESDCATPCRQLDTLADIRTEMARIYRLGTSRQIAPAASA